MPFIDSKVSVKMTDDQKTEVKKRLGAAIAVIPGKSEDWLMIDLADQQNMYFKGEGDLPIAFVGVNIYGDPDKAAFNKMTSEITKIYTEVLSIPADRIYVRYSASKDWGWNGSNF